ncbi:SGNH/GDSL hydrolase family protein [Methylorubrum thiocyanatum]|uniref:Lysophospholipase L1-like esterase n=1 Tax=Methylorubrum thiocyanatum TaxID=47958 RepID=A0AA40S4A2_9HYPH|nr:SGNH/GDSL hydrolase family protein [Methylorubrum thiocyanatum]MBA8914163.1 lysophospholipase L1-like esterase [Methylorubrum thiocyanatum]
MLFSVLAGLGVPKSVIAEPAPTYLALGDSLAYGLQIGKLKGQIAEGAVRPESFDTGYVDVLAADLKRSAPGLTVVNLGCPGESTTSFIAGPCGFATTGKPFGTAPLPLHVPYQGAQLAAATAYLAAHPGTVGTITLDIGINDLRAVQTACADQGADCIATRWPTALKGAEANLKLILGQLREAAPRAHILVGTYYNWLAAVDQGGDRFVEDLNRVIVAAAADAGARTILVFPAFNRTGDPVARLCALTLFCTPGRDLHPSDAGYRTIGELFAAAARQP